MADARSSVRRSSRLSVGISTREIFSRLSSWLAQRTTLVMAHRLSTVARCPRVVVLAEGRIVGDGPVPALARTCAEFRLLFAEQVSRREARIEDATMAKDASNVIMISYTPMSIYREFTARTELARMVWMTWIFKFVEERAYLPKE